MTDKPTKDTTLQVRCSEDLMIGLDELRREHATIPTRAGMARIILEAAIEAHRAKKSKRGAK